MCVPIKQNPQDYAVHSIFEDTILMYHKFRKNQANKKMILSDSSDLSDLLIAKHGFVKKIPCQKQSFIFSFFC